MQKKQILLIFSLAVGLAFGCNKSRKTTSEQPVSTAKPAPEAQKTTTPEQPAAAPIAQSAPPLNSPTAPATAAQAAPAKRVPVIPPPTGVNKPTASLGVPTVQKKALSASKMAFLTEQNWLVTLASGSTPGVFENHYKNRWLVFKNDQTFQVFNGAQPTNKGRWAYDEAKDIIFLNTDYAHFNNSWKCQVFKKNMLLLGNTDLNATGIQIRLFMTDKKPGEVDSEGN